MITIAKWTVILLVTVYLAALVVLYVRQREMLFPIPTAARTSPDAANYPEAEEHVLTTSDGEKIIVWHVPAKPGRPVILYFPGNGDFLAGRIDRFKAMTADGTGLIALSYAAMPARAGRRANRACCAMPQPPMPSPLRAMKRNESSPGAFRWGQAWRSRLPRSIELESSSWKPPIHRRSMLQLPRSGSFRCAC